MAMDSDSNDKSKLKYKFQDQENLEDIFSFGSALEDFIMLQLYLLGTLGRSEVSSTEEPRINQDKDDYINNTNNINTDSDGNSTGSEVNVVDPKTSIELPNDPNMLKLKDIVYSDDDEDVGVEADINNLDTHIPVSTIPTTRIHKDLPVEQII
ncbi:hypothetical protein Tco_0561203 [Tanacetum coccineum]